MSARTLSDEDLKKKFDKWRSRWTKASNDAKAENLKTGAAKKSAQDRVIAEVKNAGINVKSFKHEMTMLDHADKARDHRGKIDADADEDVLLAFDRLTKIDGSAMPLFDKATQKEIERNAERALEASDEEDEESESNVTDFPARNGASAPAPA